MKENSLAAKAYNELRRKILSNQLVSGTRLKESDWAKRKEVNRMAVREALNRLMGVKLVVPGKNGGHYVKSLTADNVRDIREVREILELGALQLVFKKNDKKHIEILESICNDFTVMVQGGYLGGACEADVKFHETLIDCTGNEKLKDLYQNSNIPLFHQKLGRAQDDIQDYEMTDLEHRGIVKAIKDRNLELAEKTLLKHLGRGEKIVLDLESMPKNT